MARLKPLPLLSGLCLLVIAGVTLPLWHSAGNAPESAQHGDLPPPERLRADEPAAQREPLAPELESTLSLPTESGRIEAMLPGIGEVSFLGRVVRRGNGSPVEGARVEILQGETPCIAVSDGQGDFAVSWDPRISGTLAVHHPDFLAMRRPNLPDPARLSSAQWTILLDPAGSIHGRLVGPGANTAMPAVAQIRCWLGNKLPQEAMAEVPVSADGRFQFESLLLGTYAVTVYKQGAPPAFATGIVLSGGRPTNVPVTIQRGINLTVRVKQSTDGAPIQGAELDLQLIQRDRDHPLQGRTRPIQVTGADGEVLFLGMGEGSYRTYIRVPWGGTAEVIREITKGTTPVEWAFSFSPPTKLSGLVLDQNGEVAAGRVVACVQGNSNKVGGRRDRSEAPPRFSIGSGTLLDTTLTDDRGRFEFEALPSSVNLALMTMPPKTMGEGVAGAAESEIVRLQSGVIRTDVILRLKHAFELRGAVHDGNGTPLAEALITATKRGTDGNLSRRVTTSKEGGTFALHEVPEGSYWLRVTRDGYGEGRMDAKVYGDLEGLDIALEATSDLSGVIVGPTGWGVPNAIVTARRISGMGATTASGDEYGRFTLKQLTAQEWTFQAKAPGFSPSESEPVTCKVPFDGELTLVLVPEVNDDPCTLLGTVIVTDSGLPPEDMQFSGFRYRKVDVTGSRFELSGAAVERAELAVSSSNAETVYFSVPEVAAGDSLNLGLVETRPTVEVRVLVTDGTGTPLRSAAVFLERIPEEYVPENVRVPSRIYLPPMRQSGSYAKRGVGMYKWQLVVRHKDWAPLSKTVEVINAQNTFRVSLDLKQP
ncbi:MAG: carboxypeptidase-like regulatory domain-containing protein [Planctomycetota bacterium]|nr:carboxypeptidase-like regulatory domain-containing protein [Planctomycetota bacterium]